MTTEEPFDQPIDPAGGTAGDRPVGGRHLRRRMSDRVIGGVAGGLGDYLNVDPILLRAGFAGLMIFGGAGLVLYVLGWILIPAEGRGDSIVEAAIRRLTRGSGRLGLIAMVLIAVIVATPWVLSRYDRFYVPPEVFFALAIALIGVVLLLPRREMDAGSGPVGGAYPAAQGPAAASAAAGQADAGAAWRQGSVAVQMVSGPRPPRERSPLGWYAVAGALLLVGAFAAVGIMASVRVTPGQYFGAGLLALGIGLVAGAWWGRARLIALLGILLLPAAGVAAFLTVPLDGGIGGHDYLPETIAEVAPAYHIAVGRLTIDLSHLKAGSQPVTLEATVGIGNLYVIIPKDAAVEVTGTVQGGELWLLGREHVGTDLTDHVSEVGSPGGGALVLTVDAGIGRVWIERSTLAGN
ncbi:MAG: PspC domain-containing protein [Chloroflexi bacterium]|nr:PspC domain-containing protein [Chloroflexota bacterium]